MTQTGIWIQSKFPSKCFACGGKVEKGEDVLYVKDIKKVYCKSCGQKEIDSMAITIYGEAPKTIPEPTTEHEEEDSEMAAVKKTRASRKPKEVVCTDISGMAELMMSAIVKAAIESNHDEAMEKIKKGIEDDLVAIYGHIPKKIVEIHVDGMKKGEVTDTTHEKFDDVLTLTSTDIPVFLVGEAGSGKNHLCKQVADALKLDFYFSNAVTNEYKITGFIDANGRYHETQFYKAFVEGGLFFFDEIDASIPEVLVLLNAAIENRYFNFPTGKFNAHPNFRIIAAGNTYGQGASLQYVGRYQLDAASLDRFAVIDMTYDKNIEMIIANNDAALVDAIRKIREIVQKNSLRIIVSYRAINQLNKLINVQKMDAVKAMNYILLKGINVDDMNIISSKLSVGSNKYLEAFKKAMKEKGCTV